jgi:hypothetical protein
MIDKSHFSEKKSNNLTKNLNPIKMKRIVCILLLLCATISQAQEKYFEREVSKISKRIESIAKEQKDSLKLKVIAIDKRLEKGEITKSTSDSLKKELASYHARRIEKLVSEQEALLQLLVQDKTNGKIASSGEFDKDYNEEKTFTIGSKTFIFKDNEDYYDTQKEKKEAGEKKWSFHKKWNRRTTSQFVFAMGINNTLTDNNLSTLGDDYQTWRSRFYELGFTWKTRFTKEPSQLYFKYGVSFLWNNLRLKDNQEHVKNGDVTNIETRIDEMLTESRLRHVQMSFPVHLEWDFSNNKTYSDGRKRDVTNNSVRLGIGGFAGFKLGTRQYLEYKDSEGVEVESVQYDNFNMNVFNYGLSSYVGYKDVSFYVKYDLNPLFKNTETRNISMGIRLDLD